MVVKPVQQSQRLESLGQLAGGIAHDFNNLLAVVLNHATFVSEAVEQGKQHPDEVRWDELAGDVEQIGQAARLAASLANRLLLFAGREATDPIPVSLNDSVCDIGKMLRRTLPEQFVLSADLDPELWWTLMDPGQAEQILVNLALNARDAMPNGGTIAASTSNVVVDEEPSLGAPLSPGRYVRLVVSDQGVGMTPEVRERAFDPFFTTKPEGEGTGLGLATVYAVAAQAGGSAWLTSESGSGTTVTITLPAIAAAQQ